MLSDGGGVDLEGTAWCWQRPCGVDGKGTGCDPPCTADRGRVSGSCQPPAQHSPRNASPDSTDMGGPA